jgi:hypothetical protein
MSVIWNMIIFCNYINRYLPVATARNLAATDHILSTKIPYGKAFGQKVPSQNHVINSQWRELYPPEIYLFRYKSLLEDFTGILP